MFSNITRHLLLASCTTFLFAGCSNNRPIEDRTLSHENQFLLPDRVRQLTYFAGPSVNSTNGEEQFDRYSEGLDFRWGINDCVTYRFPLLFHFATRDLIDGLAVIPVVGLSGFGLSSFDASGVFIQPYARLVLASTRLEHATPYLSIEILPSIRPFAPPPGYNGVEFIQAGSLHSWNRLSVSWAGKLTLSHNLFDDSSSNAHLRSGYVISIGNAGTSPSIAYRVWRGVHLGAWLNASYFYNRPRREDLGIDRRGVSTSGQLGVVWRF